MSWKLYDELISGVPEDVQVKDYCLGSWWSYVEAESGCGISYTCTGGATVHEAPYDLTGRPLREVAELAKSWCFEEATLGVAALNAWYGQPGQISALTSTHPELTFKEDASAMDTITPLIHAHPVEKPRVVVVGHFPHLEEMREYCELTVLERKCRDYLDTPDSACEFVLPGADFGLFTGVTLENKTLPRLLELGSETHISMMGPSVVMAAPLFDAGVDIAGGCLVHDPDYMKRAIKSGGAMKFGAAFERVLVQKG